MVPLFYRTYSENLVNILQYLWNQLYIFLLRRVEKSRLVPYVTLSKLWLWPQLGATFDECGRGKYKLWNSIWSESAPPQFTTHTQFVSDREAGMSSKEMQQGIGLEISKVCYLVAFMNWWVYHIEQQLLLNQSMHAWTEIKLNPTWEYLWSKDIMRTPSSRVSNRAPTYWRAYGVRCECDGETLVL